MAGAAGAGWTRVPLAGLALGCFLGVGCAEWGGSPVWALGVAVLLAWAWRAGRGALVLGAAGWMLLWVLHGERLREQAVVRQHLAGWERQELVVVVTELGEAGRLRPDAVAVVRAGVPGGRGARVGLRDPGRDLLPGDVLRVRGRGVVPGPPRNPGELDRARWMRRAGLAGELRVESLRPAGPPTRPLHRLAWRARGAIGERIVAGLDGEGVGATLIRALVLGERPADRMELFGVFRRSGTMHVFAVSGLHVGMVGMLVWGLLRGLRVPRAWGLWLVLAAMWGYALVTGLRPPAMRASLMATVFLLGYAARRAPSPANALLASVPLVLVQDSFQWRQPGFQLSYLVVAAIIVIGPRLFRRVEPWIEGERFLPRPLWTRRRKAVHWLREKTAALVVVSAAAWVGSMPLMAWHFGLVTPSAVLASVVLVPAAFLILAVALIGLCAGLLWPAAELGLNRVNGELARGAYHAAAGFASLPGACVERPASPWWGDGLVVFDLWDGDGAAYFGGGGGLLVDAGGPGEYARVVFPALREAGVGADSLVVSHADGGHCGGMTRAVAGWGARQALVPVREARSPYFRSFVAAAGQAGCRLWLAETGRRYPLGDDAELEVLWAPEPDAGSLADDQCQVLRLHWRGWRILLTGDAGFETEMRLLERGADLRSDVWVAGRHRTDLTGTLEFVRAVAPRVVVAGHARFPQAEQVPDWWAAMLEREGIDLWNQAQTGAVAIEAGADRLELRAFLDVRREATLRRP